MMLSQNQTFSFYFLIVSKINFAFKNCRDIISFLKEVEVLRNVVIGALTITTL